MFEHFDVILSRTIFHQEFNDYFDGNCTRVKNGTYTDIKNYCVEECFFENFNKPAVYSTGDSKFLIEDSSFVCVSPSSGDGGAVYTENGEVVHNRICSINCSTSGWGQYCKSQTTYGSSKKNYVIESALSRPSGETIGKAPIYLWYGIEYLTKTNISYFKTDTRCGYQFQQGRSESNSTLNSIINNTSTDEYCLRNQVFPSLKIYRCNIINNSVKDQVINNDGCNPLTVEECNIIDNSGTNTFSVESSGETKVVNCYLRNNDKTSGNVVFNNNKDEEVKLELSHLSTALCQAKNPILINRQTFSDEFEFLNLFSFCIFLFSINDIASFSIELVKHEVYNRHSLFGVFSIKNFFSFFFK